MTRQSKPAKGGVHKVEQDKDKTVYSGPDFGAHVDENLAEVRREEKTLRETGRETRETTL